MIRRRILIHKNLILLLNWTKRAENNKWVKDGSQHLMMFRSVPFLENAEAWQAQYDAIERALEGPYILPENVVHFATYAVNGNVWGKIGGHIFCYGWQE